MSQRLFKLLRLLGPAVVLLSLVLTANAQFKANVQGTVSEE